MSRDPSPYFIDDEIRLLVQHFGIARVREALTKVSSGLDKTSSGRLPKISKKIYHQGNSGITSALERIQDTEKYRLLTSFYADLKSRKILAESEDIRQFAQLVGLKDISGKSRRDLVTELMQFLLEQPTEGLQIDIKKAATVSERQRQLGFSILTDKLLRG